MTCCLVNSTSGMVTKSEQKGEKKNEVATIE